MLYIMGLGLRGVLSMTLQEREILKQADHIFFETYTSVSPDGTIDDLKRVLEKEVEAVGRKEVEEGKKILEAASRSDACLIVTGDPLSATTHNQLRADAMAAGIGVEVVENASIVTAIPGKIGLFPYRMGPPVSLPFPYDIFLPRSVCDKIRANRESGLHTIILLDLKDGRTMYPHEALETLLKMEEKYGIGAIDPSTEVFSLSRVSQPGETLIMDSVENIIGLGLEDSPSALVIPAELNHSERAFSEIFTKKCVYFR